MHQTLDHYEKFFYSSIILVLIEHVINVIVESNTLQ